MIIGDRANAFHSGTSQYEWQTVQLSGRVAERETIVTGDTFHTENEQLIALLQTAANGTSLTQEDQQRLETVPFLYLNEKQSNTDVSILLRGISRLKALKRLTIISDSLETLPNTIGRLQDLRELIIDGRQLYLLPDMLSTLTHLHRVQLRCTMLSELPPWIISWDELDELDIAWSGIHQLPLEIGQMKELRRLNLTGLKLNSIPTSLVESGLPFYFEEYDHTRPGICLHDTIMTMQPISLFALPPDQLLHHYSLPLRQVNDGKVIFLGDGNVGKTYTISRILNGCAEETAAHPYPTEETHGILIRSYHTQWNERPFDIHFWDFGGQDIMHSIHRCFLTKRTCYVVMVSTRTPDQTTSRAKYWLHTVDHFASGTPVILAVNRWGAKFSCTGLDETILRREFPALVDIVHFSAKSASAPEFRRLEHAILSQLQLMDSYRLNLPVPWDGVRLDLLSQRAEKNYCIERDTYLAICDKHGLPQEEQIRTWLLDWLNDQGVCFSYRLDGQCGGQGDYKVLDPQWLTSAIYKIIYQKDLAEDGMLSTFEIQHILGSQMDDDRFAEAGVPCLDGITYSAAQCSYVLDVMRKFKVSYTISNTKEFIPVLLDEDVPGDLELEGQVHRSYKLEYPFLPESAVHLLIINCIKELGPGRYWRKGLHLNLRKTLGAEALVKMQDDHLLVDVYAEKSEAAVSLLNTLVKQVNQVGKYLNLASKDKILAEKDGYSEWLEVDKLLKLKQRGEDFVQGEDTDYDFNTLFDAFGLALN